MNEVPCRHTCVRKVKTILSKIAPQTQTVFVQASLITDNVLVAYGCCHTIEKNKTDKYGISAMKLHMHKAFNQVEWSFLKKILARMGFDDH